MSGGPKICRRRLFTHSPSEIQAFHNRSRGRCFSSGLVCPSRRRRPRSRSSSLAMRTAARGRSATLQSCGNYFVGLTFPSPRTTQSRRMRGPRSGVTGSWMRRDGDDRQLTLVRPIAPEDAVGTWRTVLGISLEDLLVGVVRVFERVVLVGRQGRMPGIGAEVRDRLAYLFEQALILRRFVRSRAALCSCDFEAMPRPCF